MSGTRQLNSATRRVRKEQVARRSGWRCAYCRRPFGALDEVTLDHVVPVSLWRTWSAAHLVAACADCNHAKADRLPLLLALLLVFTYIGQQPTAGVPAPAGEHVHGSVHDQRSGARIGSQSADSYALDWRMLARLAHAHHAVFTSTWASTESADSIDPRSMSDLRDNPLHDRRRAPLVRLTIGRGDCLSAPRPARLCTLLSAEAAPA
ncbi:HNH endonuclease [Streptomyces alboflavus]|uniref:HNH endonuclease n=1 Tax=Streptomyces alboflavus TaxID=67267 RepID=UPI0004BECE3E|nr:HNH endonuclease [Streptomyces alboflavus]